MQRQIKIGDFVEIDIGLCMSEYATVITEHTYGYKVRLNDGSTHTSKKEDIRKLTNKETFELKLKGLLK